MLHFVSALPQRFKAEEASPEGQPTGGRVMRTPIHYLLACSLALGILGACESETGSPTGSDNPEPECDRCYCYIGFYYKGDLYNSTTHERISDSGRATVYLDFTFGSTTLQETLGTDDFSGGSFEVSDTYQDYIVDPAVGGEPVTFYRLMKVSMPVIPGSVARVDRDLVVLVDGYEP